MTAREMIPAVGARVYLRAQGLQVACVVVDVKNSYGTARVQLEPICGTGRTWVNAASVAPMAEDEGQKGFGFAADAQRGELEDLWGVK